MSVPMISLMVSVDVKHHVYNTYFRRGEHPCFVQKCTDICVCVWGGGGGGYFRILQNPSFFLVYNVNEKWVTYQFWTDALTAWSNAAIKIN